MDKIISVFFVCLFSLSALADEDNFYVGVTFGSTKHDSGFASISNVDIDDTPAGLNFLVGKKFNQYFAVEVVYAELGKIKVRGPANSQFTFNGQSYTFASGGGDKAGGNAVKDVEGTGVNGVAIYPFDKSYVFGKFGVLDWESHAKGFEFDNDKNTTQLFSIKESGTDPFWGVGFGYKFSKRLSFSLGYDNYKIKDGNTDFISFGLKINI